MSQLFNDKVSQCVIKKHPNAVAHAFQIAKEEENELLTMDGLSQDKHNPVAEISTTNNTYPKWCSLFNFKSYNTIECRLHLQRSKAPIKCVDCGGNHLAKDCPKRPQTKKNLREKHLPTQTKPLAYIQHPSQMLTSM